MEMVLRAFLSRQPQEIQDRLLHFLPEKERSRLEHLPSFAEVPSPESLKSEDVLERVHWSWLLPALRSYAPHEASLFLSALDPRAAQALSMEIPCKAPKGKLGKISKDYLRKVLLENLSHKRLLPIAFIPPSPLNKLLFLTRSALIDLIDLLAMHDLALEIRQIVETKILKKLYSFLTEAQKERLKAIASKIEPVLLPKIGLERWDGDEETLKLTLHRRGLTRLGLALARQDPSFIWILCHQLDIGRGSALLKSVKEANTSHAEVAAKQVVELLD